MSDISTDETKKLPKVVSLEFDGTRAGVELRGARMPNILNPEGKIDRNLVFVMGRLPEDFSRYTIIADGKTVAYLTRGDKNWVGHILDDDGETEKSRKMYERTETKKPRRKDSKLPAVIDSGPDLFMAVTKLAHEIWPDMKSTTRSGGGARTEKLRDQLTRQEKEIASLLSAYAEKLGLTNEDAAKQLGISLPPALQKVIESENESADEEAVDEITDLQELGQDGEKPSNKNKNKSRK